MAIDTPARHIYSGDGSTRVFPIPTYIQGDDYIRIEINGVQQVDRSKWDIVNNNIIFVIAPISESTIDVQVATSVEALAELGSITNIDIVADSIATINDIASNLDEILLADNNAIIAKQEAWRAEAERLTANSYATEPKDVYVKRYTSNNDGTFTITDTTDYSSYHWERKATILVTTGVIDDNTSSVDRVYSSNKIDGIVNSIEDDIYALQDALDSTAYTVEVIGDLITVPSEFNTVIVKDINRGGTFVSKTAVDIDPNTGSLYAVNSGTVFAKLGGGFWVRQYSGAVNVKWFGAKGDGITDDRLSFTKALLSSDSVLVPSGNTFLFDVTGGLTSAVEVVSNKTLIINGDIKSNYGELQDNPPSLFRVTGDNVSFYGTGSLIGNGYIDDRNMGTSEQVPSLIYVTGDNFKLKDVVIDTPSRAGILLYDCINANISTTFLGGVESYTVGNTAYFGVYGYLGGYHKIYDCVFKENSLGGKYISSIFLANSNYCSITNNVAYGSWEKLIYCASSHTLIESNSYHAPSPQNYTDAYRIMGDFNTLTGNYSIGANGGCQVLNGGYNVISNNTFLNCRQLGVNINDNENIGASNLSGNEVINNKITVLNGIAFGGIQVVVRYKSASYIRIEGNTIVGVSLNTSTGAIVLSATSPYIIENGSTISNNNIINSYQGINLTRVVYAKISDNYLQNIVVYPFILNETAYCSFTDNKSREVGYKGITGYGLTLDCKGNTFTDAPLSGSLTLASGSYATTVAHGGVAPHARVMLQNGNAPAGILQAITGLFTSTSGNGNFSVTTANYGNSQGNEILIYDIIQ